MRADRIATGDVIKARVKGRVLWGEVTEVKDGVVYFTPISPAGGWRHASAREIIGHWRKTGRRATPAGGDDNESAPVAPGPAGAEGVDMTSWPAALWRARGDRLR